MRAGRRKYPHWSSRVELVPYRPEDCLLAEYTVASSNPFGLPSPDSSWICHITIDHDGDAFLTLDEPMRSELDRSPLPKTYIFLVSSDASRTGTIASLLALHDPGSYRRSHVEDVRRGPGVRSVSRPERRDGPRRDREDWAAYIDYIHFLRYFAAYRASVEVETTGRHCFC